MTWGRIPSASKRSYGRPPRRLGSVIASTTAEGGSGLFLFLAPTSIRFETVDEVPVGDPVFVGHFWARPPKSEDRRLGLRPAAAGDSPSALGMGRSVCGHQSGNS